MKALLLAAGEGTRLRPLTDRIPKPMLPIDGRPLLEHLVGLLRAHGVTEVAINLHHRGEAITDHFGDGTGLGVRIVYSHEESMLGSAGAAKRLERFLDEPFLVLYGDVLTDVDLTRLGALHRRSGAAATVAVYPVDDPARCGVVELDATGRVRRFVEKPAPGETESSLGNAGVYCLEPDVLSLVPPEAPSDFGHDLFPRLLDSGRTMVAYHDPGAYYLDIGSIERYEQAQSDARAGRIDLPALAGPDAVAC
ncbi:MAG: nucleotidyltransferase family protein [Solirubrobacteraceae bacterium]